MSTHIFLKVKSGSMGSMFRSRDHRGTKTGCPSSCALGPHLRIFVELLWMGQRSPNHQLVSGKHHIIYRFSTIQSGAGFRWLIHMNILHAKSRATWTNKWIIMEFNGELRGKKWGYNGDLMYPIP